MICVVIGTCFKLAWRNLWRNRRRTAITVSSVMFAVFFALVMRSVGEGSYDQMIDNMARFHTGFIRLQDPDFEQEPSMDYALPYDNLLAARIQQSDERIEDLVPRIESFMLAAGEEVTRSAMVMGIDPVRENRFNGVAGQVISGNFFSDHDLGVVVGQGLARRLNIGVQDTLVLLGQGRFGNSASGLYEVTGILRHPITELDHQIIYMSLGEAQKLFSAEGHVTSLLVTPTHSRHGESVAESIRRQLKAEDALVVRTWPELMPELLQAIEFDRVSLYIITGILYIVIGFGLFGTILTMTLERLREFGVLLSVGMRRMQLAGVVFLETCLMSMLGVLCGTLFSLPLLAYFYRFPIELRGDAAETMLEFGVEPVLPVSLSPDLLISQLAVVFIIALVVCLYPVMKIFKLNILDAARRP